MRPAAFAALLALALTGAGSRAAALTPVLSTNEITEAVAAGAALAKAGHGYPMSQYKLFAVKDTLSILPGQGALDAIVVATPYERLRYESYLNGYQHKAMSAHDIAGNLKGHAHSVEFIMFVHSADSEKRDFLGHIGAANVVLANGKTLGAPVYDRFGPTLDFYNVVGRGRELRWIGYVGARFALTGADAGGMHGTLSFSDDEGKRYHFPFDLSRYR